MRRLTSTQAQAQALWNDQAGAHIRGRHLRPHEQRATSQVEELGAHDRALESVATSVRAARVHYEEARVAGERVAAEIQEAQYAVSVTHDFIRRGLTNEGRAAQLQEQAVAAAQQANALGGAAPGEHGQTHVLVSYAPLPGRQQAGGLLSAVWRGTNMSAEESFAYHHARHGGGRSRQQYAQDAKAWASNPGGSGVAVALRDGSSGTRYRTPGGGPGGVVDGNGGVVTFWYR